MENSPLILAHQYALQASSILQNSAPPYPASILADAASAHALAASSFAAATKTTKDTEARRTLELLVAEHQRWERRLRAQAERPAKPDMNSPNTAGGGGGALGTVDEGSEGSEAPVSSGKDKELAKDTPTLPSYPFANAGGTPHYPARLQKSTSSLATNLASARGIPQSQASPRAGSASGPSRRKRAGPSGLTPTSENPPSSKPTTNPLNLLPPDQPADTASKQASAQEEPFAKFYSGLNTLINRIGSPFTASLAFAGLPVGEESNDNEIGGAELLPRGWTQGRGRGRNLGLDNDTAGGESFYVVPTSGGTMSYAGVVRRENSGAPEADADAPLGMRRTKTGSAFATSPLPGSPGDPELAQYTGHTKTLEELQLENATLRRTLEQFSRNLQVWQRKSKESENMLKSSIIAMSKNPGNMDILSQVQRSTWIHTPYDEGEDEVFSEGRRVGEMELQSEEKRELEERLKALEEELRESRSTVDQMRQQNAKLQKAVDHFKDKWAKLAERARKRERQSGTSSNAPLAKVEENGE